MFRGLRISFLMSAGQKSRTNYEILGVPPSATLQEIKASYSSLAKKFHPDLAQGNKDKFIQISKAYQVLSDPVSRRRYDQQDMRIQTQKENKRKAEEQFWKDVEPEDRQNFERMRREQDHFMKKYAQFLREKQANRYRKGFQSFDEEEMNNYRDAMNYRRANQFQSRCDRNRRSHDQFYNQKFDRSKDSLLGSIRDCAKGLWQAWLDLKSKK